MVSDETEDFRVVSSPSWRVETQHKGEWVVAYYCNDEASANRCIERCRKRAAQWAAMSSDERMKAILR